MINDPYEGCNTVTHARQPYGMSLDDANNIKSIEEWRELMLRDSGEIVLAPEFVRNDIEVCENHITESTYPHRIRLDCIGRTPYISYEIQEVLKIYRLDDCYLNPRKCISNQVRDNEISEEMILKYFPKYFHLMIKNKKLPRSVIRKFVKRHRWSVWIFQVIPYINKDKEMMSILLECQPQYIMDAHEKLINDIPFLLKALKNITELCHRNEWPAICENNYIRRILKRDINLMIEVTKMGYWIHHRFILVKHRKKIQKIQIRRNK